MTNRPSSVLELKEIKSQIADLALLLDEPFAEVLDLVRLWFDEGVLTVRTDLGRGPRLILTGVGKEIACTILEKIDVLDT